MPCSPEHSGVFLCQESAPGAHLGAAGQGLSSKQRKGTHEVDVDAGQALQKGSCLHNFSLGLNLNTKMQRLGAQGIAQPSSPVAACSQSSLWQGRSFCFPWTAGQLGIITAAKPCLPQHNEAGLSIPRCAEGKCPVWPFLLLPFQMWRGRQLVASQERSGQRIFALETL